ncbi:MULTISPECIES: LysR family transcriptional regulator [Vibrio]|uniref:LysR family transcriptional regulator n=2 Tax=Vibrio TaxID=662 RepID=A0A7X4RVL5_9VIBR|nr:MULTISPECIES: LysR family transcriptional regulator [Vibrio]MBF9000161.1 LysR family transcriptional regulator [Vibrio nitrifigilis]MZI94405.1 LysR family transcriptional regulator [Vibrio eleionomae]
MSYLQENRIKFFYEATKHGSVRAAADYLNVAPSAVSRQISHLEQELDTVLIERHRRGIKPTEAGEEVLLYYKGYLQQQELLLDNLKSLRGLQSGKVELAIGEGYIDLVTEVMNRFSQQYPGMNIQLSVHNGNEVIRKVTEDDAHLGLVFNPPSHPKLRSHLHCSHPLCAVVDKSHPINDESLPLKMSVLKRYPIALPDTAHGIRQIIADVENDTNITLTPNVISNSLTALHRYAAHGGVTLIPAFIVQCQPEWRDQFNILPVKNARLNSTQTHIVSRVGRHLGKGPTAFLKMLSTQLTQQNQNVLDSD